MEGKNPNGGYDAKNEVYVDMLKEGIIDPAKVVRVCLENAASVAGMILTTECALLRINQEEVKQARKESRKLFDEIFSDKKPQTQIEEDELGD